MREGAHGAAHCPTLATMRKRRPVYLNLFKIRMPVAAIMSIGHRISGVAMFLLTPFAIYLLDLSLRGPSGYQAALSWLSQPAVKLAVLVGAWALAHHLLAGIRFLLIDLEWGVYLPALRYSAWAVSLGGLLVLAYTAGVLL